MTKALKQKIGIGIVLVCTGIASLFNYGCQTQATQQANLSPELIEARRQSAYKYMMEQGKLEEERKQAAYRFMMQNNQPSQSNQTSQYQQDNLTEEDKKTFLKNIATEDHNQTWLHLSSKIKDVEGLVKNTAVRAIEELLKDIQEVKS